MSKSEVLNVESLIRNIRGQRVILDMDLAKIYRVSTKRLNEQVRRNNKRFPPDFMFRLSLLESRQINYSQVVVCQCDTNLKSQFAISSSEHGGRRKLPLAFTEQGAIMAANVLNSAEAVRMSVFVVRAFVKMRELLCGSKELAEQLVALEKKLTDRLDVHEVAIVDILQRIMTIIDPPPTPPVTPKDPIGFH
jgi:hypothetical protein